MDGLTINGRAGWGVWLLTVVVLAVSLTGCGLTAPRGNDGFADLESPGLADTERVMSLSFGPTLLHFAAAHVDDDPETRELLRSLDGVRVRIYEIDGDAGRVAARLDGMSAALQGDGWERVLLVHQDDEQAHMLLKTRGGTICGMTVLVSDGHSEVVIVNLMGDIRPQQFGDVVVALELDPDGLRDVQPVAAPADGRSG